MSIHALDTVRWLAGEPLRISIYKRSLGESHVISLTIEHADAVSHLDLSASQPGVQERLVVTGEGSVVTVENLLRLTYVRQVDGIPPETPNSRVTRSWSPELSLPDSENDMQVLLGYAAELRAFGTAIREGRDVSPSIDDGVAAMRLIESIVAAPDGLSVQTP
jgi:predicted dehydrogenase